MNKKGKETEKNTKEANKESSSVKDTNKDVSKNEKEQKIENNNGNGNKISNEKSDQNQNINLEKNITNNEKNSQRNSTLNAEKQNTNTNQILPIETYNKSEKEIKTEKSRTSVAANKLENSNSKPEGIKNKNSPTNINIAQSDKKKSKHPDNTENTVPLSKRQEQVKEFESYIEDSGLPVAFQLIYSEIISKGIHSDNFFNYTALRLRQIGKELEDIKNGNQN